MTVQEAKKTVGRFLEENFNSLSQEDFTAITILAISQAYLTEQQVNFINARLLPIFNVTTN